MTVLLLSFTAVETVEVVLSRETDLVCRGTAKLRFVRDSDWITARDFQDSRPQARKILESLRNPENPLSSFLLLSLKKIFMANQSSSARFVEKFEQKGVIFCQNKISTDTH